MSPVAKKRIIRFWDIVYMAMIALIAYSFKAFPPETAQAKGRRAGVIGLAVMGILLNRWAMTMMRKQEMLRHDAEMARLKQAMRDAGSNPPTS